jgi:hypothetical protein
MGDGSSFVCLSKKANPLLDDIKAEICILIEGPPKPEGKIRNREKFARGSEMGIVKWGL